MEELRDEIYNNMQLKSTAELQSILEQNDSTEWSPLALQLVRQILIERTGQAPLPAPIPTGIPPEWEQLDWPAIAGRCWSGLKPSQPSMLSYLIVYLAIQIFSSLFILLVLQVSGWQFLGLWLLFGLALFLIMYLIYSRKRELQVLVAKARLSIKDASWDGRGGTYLQDFALQSAFSLSGQGELTARADWNGHRKLTVGKDLFERLQEQQQLDLIFLSNNFVLGPLKDFNPHPIVLNPDLPELTSTAIQRPPEPQEQIPPETEA